VAMRGPGSKRRLPLARRGLRRRVDQILHPSPASPAANRGWEPAVDQQLERLGVFATQVTREP